MVIIGRRFSHIAILDVESMPQAKEAAVKNNLLAERLRRKLNHFATKIKPLIKPVFVKLGREFKKLYDKILEMERKYQKQSLQLGDAKSPGGEVKIKELLGQAEELVKEKKYAEAEHKYIDIVGLDAKSVEAYKGLSQIYLEQKNYDQAKEALEFALKLNQNDAEACSRLGAVISQKGDLAEAKNYYLRAVNLSSKSAAAYVDLALVCQTAGDKEEAFNYLQQAVEIEPNNPRYLDLLLEISIMLGRKSIAEETLKKLKEVNPENQKLDELAAAVKKLKR